MTISSVKNLFRRIIYGPKASSESYVSYLRSRGMKIGNRTTIFAPTKTLIDETRPWLIDIGDDVQITEGVTILTHGYDWAVLKGVYGDILGSSGGGEDREQCLHWNAEYNSQGRAYWQ